MKRNALLIGLFVLTALALAAAAITFLGGNRLFEQRVRAVVYFTNSVKGLYVGAPVTFRGVPIGQVDAIGIEVDPNNLVTRVPVQLFITSKLLQMSGGQDNMDLRQLVQRGLRARLAQQSLVTGQALIDLDFDPKSPLALHGDPESRSVEIPVVKGAFDDLVAQISELPLKDTVGDLRRTLGELQQTSVAAQKVMKQAGEDWGRAGDHAQHRPHAAIGGTAGQWHAAIRAAPVGHDQQPGGSHPARRGAHPGIRPGRRALCRGEHAILRRTVGAGLCPA